MERVWYTAAAMEKRGKDFYGYITPRSSAAYPYRNEYLELVTKSQKEFFVSIFNLLLILGKNKTGISNDHDAFHLVLKAFLNERLSTSYVCMNTSFHNTYPAWTKKDLIPDEKPANIRETYIGYNRTRLQKLIQSCQII